MQPLGRQRPGPPYLPVVSAPLGGKASYAGSSIRRWPLTL